MEKNPSKTNYIMLKCDGGHTQKIRSLKFRRKKSMMKVFCTETRQEFVKVDTKKSCILKSKRGTNAENTKTKLVVDKKLHFFLQANNKVYFLFAQSFTEELYNAFKNGVTLDKALDYSTAKRNKSVMRVIDKIPSHIRYIEQEYGIQVFRKSAKKKDNGNTKRAFSFEENVACGA